MKREFTVNVLQPISECSPLETLKKELQNPVNGFCGCSEHGLSCYVDFDYSSRKKNRQKSNAEGGVIRYTSIMSTRATASGKNLNKDFLVTVKPTKRKKVNAVKFMNKRYVVKYLVHKCVSVSQNQNKNRGTVQKAKKFGLGENVNFPRKKDVGKCSARYEEAFIVESNEIVERTRLLRMVSRHDCGIEHNQLALKTSVRTITDRNGNTRKCKCKFISDLPSETKSSKFDQVMTVKKKFETKVISVIPNMSFVGEDVDVKIVIESDVHPRDILGVSLLIERTSRNAMYPVITIEQTKTDLQPWRYEVAVRAPASDVVGVAEIAVVKKNGLKLVKIDGALSFIRPMEIQDVNFEDDDFGDPLIGDFYEIPYGSEVL